MTAAEKLLKRFWYFNGLKKLTATLTEQGSGLNDSTKDAISKLQSVSDGLNQDLDDEVIKAQFGDLDFVNDFAEQLWEALDNLDKQCAIVIADCSSRKQKLTHALIWDKIGEE